MIVLDRDLPSVHGDTLSRMITDDDDPAMILVLTGANAATEALPTASPIPVSAEKSHESGEDASPTRARG